MWGPLVASWLVNNMNIIVISTISHIVIGVICTNLAIVWGGPHTHCIIIVIIILVIVYSYSYSNIYVIIMIVIILNVIIIGYRHVTYIDTCPFLLCKNQYPYI